MDDRRDGFAEADGARLYYELCGSGPLLLIVQGGPGTASFTAGLVAHLSAARTVLTYDRRGLGRSTPADDGEVTMWTHAADAAAVLAAVTDEPADVFGVSIGALLGLHLLAAHPRTVRRLVAHEPPMFALLPDEPHTRAIADAQATFETDGPIPAMRLMAAATGAGAVRDSAGPDAPAPGYSRTAIADFTRFFRYDMPAVNTATLLPGDLPPGRHADLTLTGGAESRGRWEYRCAAALSDAIDRPLQELPGGHNGVISHPRGVAAALAELLPTH